MVESAVVSGEPGRAAPVLVEDVHEWVGVLGKTGREDDELVVVVKLFQKLHCIWSHQNIDPELFVIYFDRKFNYII